LKTFVAQLINKEWLLKQDKIWNENENEIPGSYWHRSSYPKGVLLWKF